MDFIKIYSGFKLIMDRIHLKSVTIGMIFGSGIYKLWSMYYEKFVKSKDFDVDCMFFTPKQVICKSVCTVFQKEIQKNMKLSNPCNNCSLKKLMSIISSAKIQLDICMYLITYEEICKIIIRLFKSGVSIRIIVDKQMSDEAIGAKVIVLRRAYIPIKIIHSYFMMHNKFVVIDQKAVVTGSVNWTKQGFTGNYENLLVINHKKTAQKYGNKASKLNRTLNSTSRIISPRIFAKSKKLHENNKTLQIESKVDSGKNVDTNRIIKTLEGNVPHFQRLFEPVIRNRRCADMKREKNKKLSSTKKRIETRSTELEVNEKLRVKDSLTPILAKSKAAPKSNFVSTNEAKHLKATSIKKIQHESTKDPLFPGLNFEQSIYETRENIKKEKHAVKSKENLNDTAFPHQIKTSTTCFLSEEKEDNKLSCANRNDVLSLHSWYYTLPKLEFAYSPEQRVNFEGSSGKVRERDTHKHVRMERYEHFHMKEHPREVKRMKSENYSILVEPHIIVPVKQRSENVLMQRYHEKYKDELDDKIENIFKKHLSIKHGIKDMYSGEINMDKLSSFEKTGHQLQQINADRLKLYENYADSPIIQNEFSKIPSQEINPVNEEKIGDELKLKDLVTISGLPDLSKTYEIIHNTNLTNISNDEVPVPKAEENIDLDEILEKVTQSEELLELEKEIWNDLEPEIKDIIDKVDFPFYSNEEFGDNTIEIVDNTVKKENQIICEYGIRNEKISDVTATSEGVCAMSVEDKETESEAKVNKKMLEKKINEKNVKYIDHTIANSVHDTRKKTVKGTQIKQPIKNLKKPPENWKPEKASSDSKMRNMLEQSQMKITNKQIITKTTKEEHIRKYLSPYRRPTQELKQKTFQKKEQGNIENTKLKKGFENFKLKEAVNENKSKQAEGHTLISTHEELKIEKNSMIPKSVNIIKHQKIKDSQYSEELFEEPVAEKVKEHMRQRSVGTFESYSVREEIKAEKENTECVAKKSPSRVEPAEYLKETKPAEYLKEMKPADIVEKVKSDEISQNEILTETLLKSEVIEKLSNKSIFENSVHSDVTKHAAIEVTGVEHVNTPIFTMPKSSFEEVNAQVFGTNDKMCFTEKTEAEFINFDLSHLILYQPHEDQMLLYDIANCMATQAYLTMCNFKFDIEYRKNAEQMSPSGRVPFISSGLCIVSEFEPIVSFMQYKKFACIRMTEFDISTFRKLISMVVNTLEVAERYVCWFNNETLINYTTLKVGMHHPFPLNYILNWKKKYEERKLLYNQGVQGKSLDLILKEIISCFKTLSQRLGKNNFFFGTATELDALVYGHIYALLSSEQKGPISEIRSILLQYPNLLSFAVNFDKTFSLSKLSNIDAFLFSG